MTNTTRLPAPQVGEFALELGDRGDQALDQHPVRGQHPDQDQVPARKKEQPRKRESGPG
jgi:hypothetical protein